LLTIFHNFLWTFMHAAIRMASPNVIAEMCNKHDEFMSSCNVAPIHYNNMGLFCDPNIIANNKERNFQKPAIANHNSSQTLNLLRYHNIHTRTIASPSQLLNLIKSQNFFDYNCFYTLFVINTTSETICNKPIIATT
jgi:hypothetical protein